MKKGLLLTNIGTPSAPDPASVKRYLAEFLMDPDVVDLAFPLRWALVHGVILRSRPRASAEAYSKIWTPQGSPLATHLETLTREVASRLGPQWAVRGAMRYGEPSLGGALRSLADERVSSVTLFPLFPQYSEAATGSVIREFGRQANRILDGIQTRVIRSFHDDPGFIDAFASGISSKTAGFKPDFTLFSFHGLPERQLRRADPSGGHCLAEGDCCERASGIHPECYRAQCHATARLLAARLGLAPDRQAVAFQSRLGVTPWIRPFTSDVIRELARRGVRRLAVACPSFVADCLETLEEIGIRACDEFKREGGDELALIPSLNSEPLWADAVARRVAGSDGPG